MQLQCDPLISCPIVEGYLAEDGQVKACPNATRWIGIYSSRPNLPSTASGIDENRRAEVGYLYKMSCVGDTIARGISGSDFGVLP